jgi:hypothetical protein
MTCSDSLVIPFSKFLCYCGWMRAICSVFVGSILVVSGLASNAEASELGRCSSGEHWVRAHERRAYLRADGTPVDASHVSAHCHPNPPSYAKWAERLRPGMPPGWLNKTEKQSAWTDEEKERILEALSSLPKELLAAPVNGIYRLKQSESYEKNPASGHDDTAAVYDSAFEKSQNLARVLGHEFAHRVYSQFSGVDARSYNSAADWRVVKTPSGEVVFVPMREAFVEEDGKEGPNEDFANNIEHFLFSPQSLKNKSPKVYDWIRQRYGDKFILVKGSEK